MCGQDLEPKGSQPSDDEYAGRTRSCCRRCRISSEIPANSPCRSLPPGVAHCQSSPRTDERLPFGSPTVPKRLPATEFNAGSIRFSIV